MSEPRRLLDERDATSFEGELLRSWQSEQPTALARDRALGLVEIAGAAAAVGGLAAVGTAASPSVVASTATLVKCFIACAAIVVVAGGAYLVTRRASPEASAVAGFVAPSAMAPTNAPSASVAPAVPAPAPADVVTISATSLPDAPASAAPAAPAPRERVASAPSASASPSAAPSGSTSAGASRLVEQIAMMDQARSAMRSGDAARALRLLGDYEQRFPSGAFIEEAAALRVQALAAMGEGGAAKDEAARFLAAHPSSPHAQRIRAVVDSLSSP